MVLQVHDELLFECPEETAVAANEEIKLWMSNSLPSDPEVAFTTSGSITDNWADAK
jgi:DNA polymerase I-like protein with 3'-5' exonuclease and polymerase domains